MITAYQMSDEIRTGLKGQFDMSLNSTVIRDWTEHYIMKQCFTITGNRRYPQKTIESLSLVAFTVTQMLMSDFIVFGYWYKGEFYTTHKNTILRTTNELHDLSLSIDEWDELERGLYYKDTLKLYF